ncbi:glutathione S-transferase family protein [Roseobacter ponti]|uniref:Glutathione S-transferase family protein n=1 Tax=Roseobacter ponti TaxID=1891787 RepID=A0A858SQM0_9RHOB|nr:glutathione S-transferase family protein [Roseobacter ponti]QJF49983.1 glutathione S-transferase family protein [Roseobacter ponti]
MRLWYAPRTISVAAAITLEEAGLDHELVAVDFRAGEQTGDAYLKLNPKGRVPLLETRDGTRLTETGAILEYIAAITPQAGLVPDDPLEAAHMRSVMYYMASTMHVNHAHSRRGSRWADRPESLADMSAKVPETMTASAAFVASDCLRGDYILGDRFSLADAYAFVVCSWLEGDGVDLGPFPTLRVWLDRVRARPSVAAVSEKGLI